MLGFLAYPVQLILFIATASVTQFLVNDDELLLYTVLLQWHSLPVSPEIWSFQDDFVYSSVLVTRVYCI